MIDRRATNISAEKRGSWLRRHRVRDLFLATLLLTVALSTAFPAGSSAQTPARPPIPDAEKIITACWSLSKEQRESGVTNEMRRGTLRSAFCIRDAIIENFVVLAGEDERKNVVKYLDLVETGTGKLYWHLFNEIEPCLQSMGIGCGTMFHVVHNSEIAATFERILRDVIRQRREYDWWRDDINGP